MPAYSPTVWASADVITATKLNNNETGTGAALPKDGSEAMTGDLTLAGDPSNDLHAAPKQYVDNTAIALALIL